MTVSGAKGHILGVTAITEVFGDGQKLTALAVEYDKVLEASRLSASSFAARGRTILKAYANSEVRKASEGVSGCYAILELSPSDEGATLVVHQGRTSTLSEAEVVVEQVGEVWTADGDACAPDHVAHHNDAVINMVVDDFEQFE
ncbi:MAG: hypothetical protein JXA57_06955, partial [Armatimonadetes bacterium]|nr:hypothetical protein [Armatimonadota bacterium]